MQQALPMSLATVQREVFARALSGLPAGMNSPAARVMLLAIGLQESRFAARVQGGGGPARGLWQFEKGGGVHGVLTHKASQREALKACHEHGIVATEKTAYDLLDDDDVFACKFARLLLFTDAAPLPKLGAPFEVTWDYYRRNWRPGKPHRDKWDGNYTAALREVWP